MRHADSIPLYLDFETRGRLSLPDYGLDNYSRDKDTSVLCAAFAFGKEPVFVWVPGVAPLPDRVLLHVAGGGTVVAHNAAFELAIWNQIVATRHGVPTLSAEQCRCTMVAARYRALPASLKDVAHALGLPVEKSEEGRRIMLALSKPRSVEPLTWWEDTAARQKLYDYCARDVEVLRELHACVGDLPKAEQALWVLDQRINSTGVAIDTASAHAMGVVMQAAQIRANTELARLTGGVVDAVTKTAKLKQWCIGRGVYLNGVAKADVEELLASSDCTHDVRAALELRQQSGRTSVAKVAKLLSLTSTHDGRLRNSLQFYGADTGRWAGRGVQIQNLPRGSATEEEIDVGLRAIRQAANSGASEIESFLDLFGDPTDLLMSALRALFVPSPNTLFAVGDFANIEGRVLAWLAGEEQKRKAFADFDAGAGPDIYVNAYSKAFGVPPSAVTPERRHIGKTMELLLGYGGSVGAIRRGGGALVKNKTDAELLEWVMAWRAAHPATVCFWALCEQAAKASILSPGTTFSAIRLSFALRRGFLQCRLPSGRTLFYPEPKLCAVETPIGLRDALTYKSRPGTAPPIADATNTSKWARIGTYGGKLVENAVQAVARDVLAEALLRVASTKLNVVMHVHDEIVCESDTPDSDNELKRLMEMSPPWADGLPISVKVWHGHRYKKG